MTLISEPIKSLLVELCEFQATEDFASGLEEFRQPGFINVASSSGKSPGMNRILRMAARLLQLRDKSWVVGLRMHFQTLMLVPLTNIC